METMLVWIHNYEYPGIVVLLMLGIIGLPIPDETLLLLVGYLSFSGELSLPLALLSAMLGTACGITVSYGLGISWGHVSSRHLDHGYISARRTFLPQGGG